MGCDIHLITEIRQNGKWIGIDEYPTTLTNQDYGVFAVLADVRNSFNYDHFEAKGLPTDLSAMKFEFKSYMPRAEERYKNDSERVFVSKDGEYKDILESNSVVYISKERYDELLLQCDGRDNMGKEDREAFDSRYASPFSRYSPNGGKENYVYGVYDAESVGGKFQEIPLNKVFPTFEEFMKEYYKDDWDEDAGDYGHWRVDFTAVEDGDYHTPSYLNLRELKEFDYETYQSRNFKVDKELAEAFTRLGGKLPEGIRYRSDTEPADIVEAMREAFYPTVILSVKLDAKTVYEMPLMAGIRELEDIAAKYEVDDEDIRIVFAFDN